MTHCSSWSSCAQSRPPNIAFSTARPPTALLSGASPDGSSRQSLHMPCTGVYLPRRRRRSLRRGGPCALTASQVLQAPPPIWPLYAPAGCRGRPCPSPAPAGCTATLETAKKLADSNLEIWTMAAVHSSGMPRSGDARHQRRQAVLQTCTQRRTAGVDPWRLQFGAAVRSSRMPRAAMPVTGAGRLYCKPVKQQAVVDSSPDGNPDRRGALRWDAARD